MVLSLNLNDRNKTSCAFSIRIKKVLLPIVLIFYFTASAYAAYDEWRGWRGLEKQACSDSSGPVIWSSTENILWKVHIDGDGFSSPVVSENEVFITSAHIENGNLKLNSLIVLLLSSLIFLFILRNQYLLIRNIVRSGISKNDSLFLLMTYGFLIFGFCTVCWMYFSESPNVGERALITYMFSGTLSLFCILLSASMFHKKSIYRLMSGILVIFLAMLLVKFRPMPDFFLLAEFFKVTNIWLFQLTVPSIILPVILSLYLIFNTLSRNRWPGKVKKFSDQKYTEKLYFISSRKAAYTAVIAGFSGFIAIPLIAAAKWLMRSDLARIQDPLNLILFFNPGYSYPFFLGMISIGYLLWFFIEKNNDGSDPETRSWLFPVLTISSVIFFIVLNYGRHKPTFQREIVCVDRQSGAIEWKRMVLPGPAVDCSNYNSQATPTPLIDSNSVYAYFGSAGLIATDMSGNVEWKNTSLPFKSIHGAGSSPVFWKGGIVILSSMSESPYLTSLDNKTGKEQWKTDLPEISGVGGEYRTPIVFESDAQELILEWSTSRSEIVIYEAKTGRIKNKFFTDWAERDEAITTPCLNDGILYLSDNNSVVALDIYKLLNNDSSILWKTELSGRGPTTSSPVFSNGLLFMISDNGFANCLNAKTGDILWQKKLRGLYFSSPVSIGKNIFFSNSAGITTILKSAPEYTRIAENVLPEGIYSTLVPVDGELFIRTKNTLWCIK